MSKKEKLVIIDGNAILHRAYHALPPLQTKDGTLVNAVYGFAMIFLKLIKDLKPDYVAVTFDRKEKTFRHEAFVEYKAQREKRPDELYAQIPLIKEIIAAFNLPIYELAGFEADDLIGTIATKVANQKNLDVIIATGDLDTLQLITDQVKVLSLHKGISDTITYDAAAVKERYGLNPNQMIDYKALRGDPSDNIPGVKGIGEKTAQELIIKYKTLDNLYKHLTDPNIKPAVKEKLATQTAEAKLSKELVTIKTDTPIDFKLTDCQLTTYDADKLVNLFQKLEFKSLLSKLPAKMADQQALNTKKQVGINYLLIDDEATFKKFLTEFTKQTEWAWDTETTSTNVWQSKLLGISFCWQKTQAYYLNTAAHPDWLKTLAPYFAEAKIKKIAHNAKYDIEALMTVGLAVNGLYFDTMLASYLLNPGSRQHSLDGAVFAEFGVQTQPIEDLIGRGKNQITLAEVPVEKVSIYSCEDADWTWRLYEVLSAKLEQENLLGVFNKIDLPLVEVLAQIEKNGILLDTKFLNQMSNEVATELEQLTAKIYQSAGEEFNIASPKQLKEILFGKLKISTWGVGKTKTGFSTAADELDKLTKAHPIIPLIKDYRELAKLQSTYLVALPELIDPQDKRLHTSFNQTVTATGRLSSSEPNLQNIPIRTDLGKKIRRAFIAPPGYQIISADYSQIELRVVASLANDPKMIKAFEDGEDIHTRTAADIYDIPLTEVTSAQRREAKAVNFGVIYGMGVYGLAQGTGVSMDKARDFIERYFANYQRVQEYLQETIEYARENGYVETIFGRRRYIPEINSGVQQIRSGAERIAVNTPIQGTAADLIKLAMIKIQLELPQVSPKSKMLLQVHDELVFETPTSEVAKVAKFVDETMSKIFKLRVPIGVEVEVGNNWGQTKPLTS
ncbi:MAG: DNA polymerase I [Candidatus Buchananbacteria bacterium]